VTVDTPAPRAGDPAPAAGDGADSLLLQLFPTARRKLPFLRLGSAPTPVRQLTDLPGGGPEVWVKDESRYGGPWGGNKVRKLEWILPDVQRRHRRTILTFGALGTNHGLATALYARELGISTAVALVDQPVDAHVRAQLDRLRASGATLHFTHTPARTTAVAPLLIARHCSPLPPYVLPAGGSSPIGTLGYVEAGLELAAQIRAGELPEPERVFVAVGSGATAAGLALGLRMAGLRISVTGVVVNDLLRLDLRSLQRLARRAARLLRRRGAVVDSDYERIGAQLDVTRRWLGAGYGEPTAESREALRTAAARGLELDPVYTAKAFAAVLGEREESRAGDGPWLFLQTHGPRTDGPPPDAAG